MYESKRMEYIMSKCLKCNVEISDGVQICPLCRCVLQQDDSKEEHLHYPHAERRRERLRTFSRIIIFGIIAAFAVLCFLNWKTEARVHWDYIAGIAMLYLLLTIHICVLHRHGYRFRMLVQTLAGILAVFALDFILGAKGWSLNYVLPAAIVLLDVAVVILMIVNSRNWQSYIPVELLLIILSMIPVILWKLSIDTVWYTAAGCVFITAAVFLGTLIIGGRKAASELKRRFHV